MTELDVHATEGSSFPITVELADSQGTEIVPNDDVMWSLVDEDGVTVNNRHNVSIPSPASTITILLSDDDLAIPSRDESVPRWLVLKCTYDSTLGDEIPLRAQVKFWIDALKEDDD